MDMDVDTMNLIGGGNNMNNHPNLASKQRLRWTHKLHERFVDAVAQLGGPDRKCNDEKDVANTDSNEDGPAGLQITESLKLQMEVQKRLHEQLEVQRQLQLRIEAQGKYLKKIIEEQQILSGVLTATPEKVASAAIPIDEDHVSAQKRSESPSRARAISIDEQFSTYHQPSTPESGCHTRPFTENPDPERSLKKQRVTELVALASEDRDIQTQIFDTSLNYPASQKPFLTQELFNPRLR